MSGASWLQVSQSMQVESTKKSPGTFSGKRCCRLAMVRIAKLRDCGIAKFSNPELAISKTVAYSDNFRNHAIPQSRNSAITQFRFSSNLKLINQPVQVGTTDAELFRGGDFISFAVQGADDHAAFQCFDGALERRFIGFGARKHAQHLLRNKFEPELRVAAEHHKALHQVFKFAYVAGPFVVLQHLDQSRIEFRRRLSVSLGGGRGEVRGQEWNIIL